MICTRVVKSTLALESLQTQCPSQRHDRSKLLLDPSPRVSCSDLVDLGVDHRNWLLALSLLRHLNRCLSRDPSLLPHRRQSLFLNLWLLWPLRQLLDTAGPGLRDRQRHLRRHHLPRAHRHPRSLRPRLCMISTATSPTNCLFEQVMLCKSCLGKEMVSCNLQASPHKVSFFADQNRP